jgi:hypothetical protein
MDTASFAPVLLGLFNELIDGSRAPGRRAYILNQGDDGLLVTLERLPAAAASAAREGPTIAAHVDHVRYGLSLLNRWANGTLPPESERDWTASWRRNVVSDAEWRSLLGELRREADVWKAVLATPREVNDVEADWLAASVAHLAYHMGAIRQIDRNTRGPSADEEARATAALRGS